MKDESRAKRSLSQNFLVDPNIRRKLVELLEAGPEDVVLEIGPGHGELTELLAGRVRRLVLIEKDDRLAASLASGLGSRDDVELVHADALRVDLSALIPGSGSFRVISNLPYGITSPLLFRLLDMNPSPQRVVVLVQREVAERITASPGSRVYGALSVGVQVKAEVRIAFRVGRKAFRPAPAVDSASLVLEPRRASLSPGEWNSVRRLTRVAFSRRRKQLRTILRNAPEYDLGSGTAREILESAGLPEDLRPEAVSPPAFVRLAGLLRPYERPLDG